MANDVANVVNQESSGVTTQPSHGTITGEEWRSGKLVVTYTPDGNYVGTDSFEYQLCSLPLPTPTTCSTAEVTVTITIFTKAVDDSASALSGQSVDIEVTDNDTVATVKQSSSGVSAQPQHGTIIAETWSGKKLTITYKSDAGFVGTDTFKYELCVTQSGFICSEATVTITVNEVPPPEPPPDPPTARDDTASTTWNNSVSIDVLGNDTTGPIDSSKTGIAAAPGDGTAALQWNSDGTFRIEYTPDGLFLGTDTFDYRLCRTKQLICSTATVTVDVERPSSWPTAVDDAATTGMDAAVPIHVMDNDSFGTVDKDLSKVTAQPGSGSAAGNWSGDRFIVTYTPDDGFSGTDSFKYRLCTGMLLSCDGATVTVTVEAPPPPDPDDDDDTDSSGGNGSGGSGSDESDATGSASEPSGESGDTPSTSDDVVAAPPTFGSDETSSSQASAPDTGGDTTVALPVPPGSDSGGGFPWWILILALAVALLLYGAYYVGSHRRQIPSPPSGSGTSRA